MIWIEDSAGVWMKAQQSSGGIVPFGNFLSWFKTAR